MQRTMNFVSKTRGRKQASWRCSSSQTPLQMPTVRVIQSHDGLDYIYMTIGQWKWSSGGSDRQWRLRSWWTAALLGKIFAQVRVMELEIHKDTLSIHVNPKIWKVTNGSTWGKLNRKHLVSQVLWTNGYESRVVWKTVPSRLKIRKEAREMQCSDHFFGKRELITTR